MSTRLANNKTSSLSYLRIFATIAVLCSHAWSTLTNNPDLFTLTNFEQISLEVGWNLMKWDIPIFFMITGAIFLKPTKYITISAAINKYSKRMILALAVFGIPYAMMMIYFETKTISLSMIPQAILRVITGESFGHLWYMYILIGIYLLLPAIKTYVNNASDKEYNFVMLILFIFDFCFVFIKNLTGTSIAFVIPVQAYSCPLFWLMFGNYIMNKKPKWTEIKWIPIVGVVSMLVLTIIVVLKRGPFLAIMSYDSPVDVILAGSIFALFTKIKRPCTERLWKIDRLCFGVYLIHPLFIHFTYKFLRITPTGHSLFPILTLVFTVAFIIISFAASYVMSLIKPLKEHIL